MVDNSGNEAIVVQFTFNSKSRDGELSRFSSRYDDDLDEVEEEDHFEDVDDLEVSFLAIVF